MSTVFAHAPVWHTFRSCLSFLFTPLLMGVTAKCVAVFPPEELENNRLLFDSLAEILPVAFTPFVADSSVRPDACIFLAGDSGMAQELDLPCYVWEKQPSAVIADSPRVKFSACARLHFAVRGQEIKESCKRDLAALPLRDGDQVMAAVSDVPIWTVRGQLHRVSVAPPRLSANQRLQSHFSPKSWLSVLPLLHFLRSVTGDINWQAPPPRACFLFDDPNLHALTYGYLDFRQLAREAQEQNYHVAIATVPMDAWYVNPEAARLFREHAQYISLTTHGCRHTKNELLVESKARLPLLAQALRRVESLEARSQLDVSRIMVAPHSACAESTTDLMLSLGYEGATISTRALGKWNRNKQWPLDFGLGTVLWMGAGFPILYRFEMRSYMQTQIRLSTFLGQPMVFYGHHGDCSAGLQNLGRAAATLASFGAHWGSLKSIMRGNYRTRSQGELLHVQMASRCVELDIPQGVRAVAVHRPWMKEDGMERLSSFQDGHHCTQTTGPLSEPIPVVPGSRVRLSDLPDPRANHKALAPPPGRVWPIIRRALTEARDRLQPFVFMGANPANFDDC